MQLSGQIEIDDYMAFGISGSDTKSQMLGADVAVTYIDGHLGYAIDYHIDALCPCVRVLDQNKGVCRDDVVGGQDNFQLHTFMREDGINKITFRRSLISCKFRLFNYTSKYSYLIIFVADEKDKEFHLDRPIFIIWAVGKLDTNKEPAFHEFYPKKDHAIHFNSSENVDDCFSFTQSAEKPELELWERNPIVDKTIRSFTATLGPSGGKKGYEGITKHVSNGLAWYINGYLSPDLFLRRGLTYSFKVRGGNNPHSPEFYHPMVITDEPHGGFDRLTDSKQSEIRVLAGVEYSRRGRPKPTSAGPLCISRHSSTQDRRLDDDFPTFRKFNRSLTSDCVGSDSAILEITPNSSWPDTVYYNSFTQRNMGWRIHVVDSYVKAGFSAGSKLTVNISATLFTIFLILNKLL